MNPPRWPPRPPQNPGDPHPPPARYPIFSIGTAARPEWEYSYSATARALVPLFIADFIRAMARYRVRAVVADGREHEERAAIWRVGDSAPVNDNTGAHAASTPGPAGAVGTVGTVDVRPWRIDGMREFLPAIVVNSGDVGWTLRAERELGFRTGRLPAATPNLLEPCARVCAWGELSRLAPWVADFVTAREMGILPGDSAVPFATNEICPPMALTAKAMWRVVNRGGQ